MLFSYDNNSFIRPLSPIERKGRVVETDCDFDELELAIEFQNHFKKRSNTNSVK